MSSLSIWAACSREPASRREQRSRLASTVNAPVISSSGRTLYVPFTGNIATPGDGGVAIIDVEESECCSKIWKALDGCPSCDTANCVVLATLKGFVVGDTFENQTDPPADPATDTANHMVRIDNRTGRRMLPSTSTLAEIVQCLCAQGKPKDGKDGKNGTNGKDGTDGKDGRTGWRQGLDRTQHRRTQLDAQSNSTGNYSAS